jgi:hypothetical protein
MQLSALQHHSAQPYSAPTAGRLSRAAAEPIQLPAATARRAASPAGRRSRRSSSNVCRTLPPPLRLRLLPHLCSC